MDKIKLSLQKLNGRQKMLLIGGFFTTFIILIIIISILFSVITDPKVKINFNDNINIPGDELRKTRENLYNVIRDNSSDFNNNITFIGDARDYKEESIDKTTTATFIVDFNDIKQSYFVSITWPNPNDGSPNINISCPLLDSKYPETPCSTEINSSSDISSFLPYTGTISNNQEYVLVNKYVSGKVYLEVQINSCGNSSILNEALESARKFVSSIHFNPDDFNFYTPTNLCDGEAHSHQESGNTPEYYVQVNHANTKDENVNKYLPYFIPDSYNVYPITDENGDITSIKAELSGCTDFQTAPMEEEIKNYLQSHNINYDLTFEYCIN